MARMLKKSITKSKKIAKTALKVGGTVQEKNSEGSNSRYIYSNGENGNIRMTQDKATDLKSQV